jgi:hypothetical protein
LIASKPLFTLSNSSSAFASLNTKRNLIPNSIERTKKNTKEAVRWSERWGHVAQLISAATIGHVPTVRSAISFEIQNVDEEYHAKQMELLNESKKQFEEMAETACNTSKNKAEKLARSLHDR